MTYETYHAGRHRRGFTLIESVVAASLLLVVMTFVSSLVFRIDEVWKDVGHKRIAMNELSNQLEVLSLLRQDQVVDAIATMEPSIETTRTLTGAQLTGELIDDQWGSRIVLHVDWQRKHPGKPITMSAWLVDTDAAEVEKQP